MEHFTIHAYDAPRPTEIDTIRPCISEALEGQVIFLHQLQGFWIAAEDNQPEAIMVHVAEKRRYATIDELADDQPFTIFSKQGAMA